MASDKFTIRIYTPAGLILTAEATAVRLTASDGEIGILPQHTRYVGLLGIGVLEYQSENGKANRLVASNGFCNFVNDGLLILADSVDLPEEVNSQTYDKERASLQKLLQTADSNADLDLTQQKLRRIEAIDQLLAVH